MLVVLFGVGWSALPADLVTASSALRFEDKQANGSSIAEAVFLLREDGVAMRFGNADMEAPGIVRVGLYDPGDPLLTQATAAVSLPGDGRLLWLLASSAERANLREKALAVMLGLSDSATEVVRSPTFQAEYRDRFMRISSAALQSAWQVSRDSGAWQDLMRSYQPVLRQATTRDLRPIIEHNFRGVALAMLKANVLSMLDPFHDQAWDTGPVQQALEDSLQEIRDRGVAERLALRLLDMPQTTAFLRVFVGSAGDTLLRDQDLRDLAAEVIADRRLGATMEPAIDRMIDLGRTAPRLLVSLHGSPDLNLVAAAVIRTMVSGRPDRVVVIMNPRQRDELLTLEPGMVHPLTLLAGDNS